MLVGMLVVAPATAQQQDSTKAKQRGIHFVDANGDGYNDNAADADGDGIPNGLDPDYKGERRKGRVRGFIDLNGDGLNDYALDHDGDGIPNGLDPDYDGAKMMRGSRGFVDVDGDGINDNARQRRGSLSGATGGELGFRRQAQSKAGGAIGTGSGDANGPKGKVQQRVKGKGNGN
jgi:hypothetical protein